jgi:flagellar motor switch protein FliM
MTEILSGEEIDALLNAIASGKVEATDYTAAGDKKKIRIYDFRRPDKFSRDHIRTLQMVHETFGRLTTTMLSAQLRTPAEIHVVSVDQLTFEEFIRSIPNPTALGIINVPPLPGSVIIEIDPGISFTVIDRLAGGRNNTCIPNRELTDIELLLMEGIFTGMMSNLSYSWANIASVNPELANIETNPQFAQIVPPSDMVLLVTFEARIGEIEGMLNICIPYITFESVIHKLSAGYWTDSEKRKSGDELPVNVRDSVFKRYISYQGVLPNMAPDEVRKLKHGMKIVLNPVEASTAFYEYAGKNREAHNG